MSQDNVQVVLKALENVVKRDMPALKAYLAADCVWSSTYPSHLPFSGEAKGPDAGIALLMRMSEPFEVLGTNVLSIVAQGDSVVLIVEEKLRAKATGKVGDNKLALVLTVRNGQIASALSLSNTFLVAELLRPDKA